MPVNIRGKEYTTVKERIVDLHNNTNGEYSLETELVKWDSDIVIVKATLTIGPYRYTGHAYERESSSQINKTSALENCETSAIGRALAAAGYGGSEYASANEVQQAIHQQANGHQGKPQPTDDDKRTAFRKAVDELLAPATTINQLLKEYEASNLDEVDPADRKKFYGDLKASLPEVSV